jgi:hypothetical protein
VTYLSYCITAQANFCGTVSIHRVHWGVCVLKNVDVDVLYPFIYFGAFYDHFRITVAFRIDACLLMRLACHHSVP